MPTPNETIRDATETVNLPSGCAVVRYGQTARVTFANNASLWICPHSAGDRVATQILASTGPAMYDYIIPRDSVGGGIFPYVRGVQMMTVATVDELTEALGYTSQCDLSLLRRAGRL